MLTRVSNFTSYDGIPNNNEGRKEFQIKKMLKLTQFCNF